MSEYQCDHCNQEVPNGDGLYLGDARVCEKCYMTCHQCGSPTNDDESIIWVSMSDGKDAVRICFTCCAPDTSDDDEEEYE